MFRGSNVGNEEKAGSPSHRSGGTIQVIRATWLVFILSIFGLSAIFVYSQYRAANSRASTDAYRTAHVVATQYYWVLQASAQALQRIEDAIGDPAKANIDDIADISVAVQDLPSGSHYSVYSADGELRYSSLPGAPVTNVKDRPYFKDVERGQELTISPQVTDRQSGQRVFIVARRLNRGSVFLGAATIAIPQDSLSQLSAALGFTDMSTISLVRADGMLIVRSLAIEPMDLSGSALFDELKRSKYGVYDTISPADNVRRVVGYWTIDDWPVIAVAGVSHISAYKLLFRSWLYGSLFLAPMALLVWFLLRRVDNMVKREELQNQLLAKAHDRANYLLREIHHRVKNNLQTVISLIRLEGISDEAKGHLTSRIATMVEVHEEMYGSDQFESVNLQTYLGRLVERIAAGQQRQVRMDVDIAPIEVPGDRAMLLGLLVNELTTNAYKHAYATVADPQLTVRLHTIDEGRLRLEVSDNGPGYDTECGSNMGKRLIAAFASQLGGTLASTTDGGFAVLIDFPLNYER